MYMIISYVGMFTPTADGRSLWINRASGECNNEEYKLIGVLLGLAVYNGVLLGMPYILIVSHVYIYIHIYIYIYIYTYILTMLYILSYSYICTTIHRYTRTEGVL